MGCKIENSPRQIPGGCDECSLTSPLFTLIPPPWRSIASLFSLNVRELNVQWLDKCFIAMNDYLCPIDFFFVKITFLWYSIVIFQLIIFKFNRDWKLFLRSMIKLSIFGISSLWKKETVLPREIKFRTNPSTALLNWARLVGLLPLHTLVDHPNIGSVELRIRRS